MNFRSIRFRLTAWHAVLLAGLLLLFWGFVYFTLNQFLEKNLRDTLSQEAQTISEALLKNIDQTGEPYVANEIEEHFAPRITSHFLRVTRADRSVLYQSGPPHDRSFDPLKVSAARTDEPSSWREESMPSGINLIVYTMVYSNPQGKQYSIQAGTSHGQVGGVLHGLSISLMIAFPLMIAASIGGSYFLMRNALRPLDQIATAAEKITSRNLNERVLEVSTGDELEKLAASLNRMMARLEESFHHINRFSADASHEIRTPLAIIRGELENALAVPGLTPDLREPVASALEEAEQLSRIVELLLEMSRLDAGETLADPASFDFTELTKSTVEQMQLLADDKQIELNFEGPAPLRVKADPIRLRQVVVNLIDNAIKYTLPGGSISVSSFAVNARVVLEVVDTGIGIPHDALLHVFDRFYRVDKTRSRQFGGTGLGLAIVKSICTSFGGTITVQSMGSGTTFRVELPLEHRQ